MNSETLKLAGALAAMIAVSGCAEHALLEQPWDAKFGDANRQTMMAQVIDPDPVYDTEMAGSAEHAQQAVERYRTDAVKQPDTISTTEGTGPE